MRCDRTMGEGRFRLAFPNGKKRAVGHCLGGLRVAFHDHDHDHDPHPDSLAFWGKPARHFCLWPAAVPGQGLPASAFASVAPRMGSPPDRTSDALRPNILA